MEWDDTLMIESSVICVSGHVSISVSDEMTGPPETLDSLVARLADGERSVFASVFAQLWPPTLRFCKGLLKNETDASDAAQQAMMKILERASDYDRRRPALPWALAIASWECRTLLRNRSRRRDSSETAAPESQHSETQDDAYIRQEMMGAAVSAMGTLSEIDRETLAATFWESAASVAGATLRKRRERALERLKSAFRRLYGFD